MAEDHLKQRTTAGDSCFMFGHSVGGLVGWTVRRLLVQFVEPGLISDELVLSLVFHYGFAADWVPPRLLVREALAHAVHLRHLVDQLRTETGGTEDSQLVIANAASGIQTAEDAYRLNDEQTDEVLQALR